MTAGPKSRTRRRSSKKVLNALIKMIYDLKLPKHQCARVEPSLHTYLSPAAFEPPPPASSPVPSSVVSLSDVTLSTGDTAARRRGRSEASSTPSTPREAAAQILEFMGKKLPDNIDSPTSAQLSQRSASSVTGTSAVELPYVPLADRAPTGESSGVISQRAPSFGDTLDPVDPAKPANVSEVAGQALAAFTFTSPRPPVSPASDLQPRSSMDEQAPLLPVCFSMLPQNTVS